MKRSMVQMLTSRYLRSRSGDGFVFMVSLVSFVGLVLGVIALIAVVSVMNGFDRELRQRLLGAVPHIIVENDQYEEIASLLSDPAVVKVTPILEQPLLLVTNRGSHLLNVFGINPDLEAEASTIPDSILSGRITDLIPSDNGLMVGSAISRRYGLMTGDRVNLVVPRLSPRGKTLKPKVVSAVIKGEFSLGSELDYSLGLMNIEDLAIIAPGKPGTRITVDNVFSAGPIARHLNEKGYVAATWANRYGDFFDTVRMEKIMMYVLLSFVVAIASFSIVSGLTMLVNSKRQDIAVLRTMGLEDTDILRVFVMLGLSIAIAAVVIGVLIGIPLTMNAPAIMSAVQAMFGFSIVEGTYFSQIPVDIRWGDILVICGITLFISGLASIFPAFQAARLDPAQILRYE